MYQEHFGFQEPPFSIAPDPRYLFMSERHQEALAHLLYGIRGQGGFILLTGEVGTGKTTICRCLLEQLPEQTEVAFLFNPKLTAAELLATICDEFRIPCPDGISSIKIFTDKINAYLLEAHAEGRKTVLIIDEAQNLEADVLEQIRLLTNLETNQQKLLQIVMLGQPELLEMLRRPELRQLSQRITARYHLEPLTAAETAAYVRHRLNVAGVSRPLFPQSVVHTLFRLSDGIPRLINLLCDRALLGTYVQDQEKVDRKTLVKAAKEVKGTGHEKFPASISRAAGWVLGLLLLIGGSVAVTGSLTRPTDRTSTPSNPPAATELSHPSDASGVTEPLKKASGEYAPLVWPSDIPASRSELFSYQNLFRLWGVEFDPLKQGSACQFARSRGLRCFSGTGSLRDLRHLDRPAILTVYDDLGQEFFIVLTQLESSSGVVVLGDRVQPVTEQELVSRWRGHYLLLWRLESGDSGQEVDWLARGLGLSEGRETPGAAVVSFDDQLADRLKRFQLASGLVPDGIAGPRTLIQLNSRLYSDLPRLTNPVAGETR